MIGAMPAVAVRHERRRQEKRTKRPSLLYLQSPLSRTPSPVSPLQSPPSVHCAQPPPEVYVCGKVSVLHIVVVSLLLAAVLLIVGLVQLKPGADASRHRFLLLGSGTFLLLFGVVLAIVRCCVLPWAIKRRHRRRIRKGVTGLEEDKPQLRASLDVVPHEGPGQESTPGHDGVAKGPRETTPGHESAGKGPRVNTPGHESTAKGPRVTTPGHENGVKGPRVTTPGHENGVKGPRVNTPGHESVAKGPRETTLGHENALKGPRESTPGHESAANGPRETTLGHESAGKGPRETVAGLPLEHTTPTA